MSTTSRGHDYERAVLRHYLAQGYTGGRWAASGAGAGAAGAFFHGDLVMWKRTDMGADVPEGECIHIEAKRRVSCKQALREAETIRAYLQEACTARCVHRREGQEFCTHDA